MYILLTDILTCPRCGPDFGLILLADRMEERRVFDGMLGCANCREHYPITAGFGAFGGDWPMSANRASDDDAVRLAALLGVSEGPGFVLLVGEPAVHADAIADMIPGLEVIAATDTARTWNERAGVSRIGIARTLPFLGRKLHGIALAGDATDALLDEAARALAPLARLVLFDAPAETTARLAGLGLGILAQQDGTIVAART